MSEHVETGMKLLLIGMITVFFVLGIVVLTGRVLILIIGNLPGGDTGSVDTQPPHEHKGGHFPSRKMAAIATAIHLASGGTAVPDRIEKME